MTPDTFHLRQRLVPPPQSSSDAEIEITTRSTERNDADPGASTRAGYQNRAESSRFASDLPVSMIQRRPQIHYKPIICAGPGMGLATGS